MIHSSITDEFNVDEPRNDSLEEIMRYRIYLENRKKKLEKVLILGNDELDANDGEILFA